MVNPERFPLALAHTAATLYYLQDATQAEIAERIGTSRATVSRLLREARERGLVRIEVPPLPVDSPGDLADRVRAALGLQQVSLCPSTGAAHVAEAVSPVVVALLEGLGLEPGDVLLVSSGRTVYEIAQRELPRLPGVLVAPMVGGQDEPEAWYQTNEITRRIAVGVGGTPRFLYAPAFPGHRLRHSLAEDAEFQRFTKLWSDARCALMGIGAPPLQRESIPGFVPTEQAPLATAVGDVASRFYDATGTEVSYEGADRLIAIPLEVLRRVPVRIAVAYGAQKIPSIVAGARGGHFSHLVIDPATATALLSTLEDDL
ncbi:sugar-binding transcriptional regulator [Kineococcus radiotolerans]|uniref:Transcriptional regulator, DeoR family n=1 Tax=Kineococcus radiotolerans (strain ATCC BAA-149 / DSM 14245 / SRS30216) TaxID=266940 RepID=A6W9T4_KINRD|nr:sugar-binding domain-containing protein [Kineococcus radiotolerans]ABS03573.1 transcriptional regulator, DeoR family [Kineococcus radiotolerans SRS30216 = ATCC BAA-149]